MALKQRHFCRVSHLHFFTADGPPIVSNHGKPPALFVSLCPQCGQDGSGARSVQLHFCSLTTQPTGRVKLRLHRGIASKNYVALRNGKSIFISVHTALMGSRLNFTRTFLAWQGELSAIWGLRQMEEPHEDPIRPDFYARYICCACLRSKRERVIQREYFRCAARARRGIHAVFARQGKNVTSCNSSRKKTHEPQKFGVIKLPPADAKPISYTSTRAGDSDPAPLRRGFLFGTGLSPSLNVIERMSITHQLVPRIVIY
jgi:hypothetical protein